MKLSYEIIVVGGGHAGCEAAHAAAKLGRNTLLITHDMSKFAFMSCNPAIGGVAKGQIVREIDALGGISGIVTDLSSIQFRMLNRSKGPAMWSPRSQCDRNVFTNEWRKILENTNNLHLFQDDVVDIITKNNKIIGVKTSLGIEFKSNTVILTAGTFLNGKIFVGKTITEGGRIGEPSSKDLTSKLVSLGFISQRMKTGTPARIDGRFINFAAMQEQEGEKPIGFFSYLNNGKANLKQRSCFLTYTNNKVHDKIISGIKDSPLYDGTIVGIGPRYCPSIETKLITFSDKDKHQLFIEPEGESSNEYYINGFSSSLSYDVQFEALKHVQGFENIQFYRPGYAIEYDYFDPLQVYPNLETKLIKGLFFAGQILGTTGYEEAAAQGLMAGINAHLSIDKMDTLILGRDQAYIGVLIDDLTTKGVDEPYRMFTSRAEYRALLRQDNADERLTILSYNLGLASYERYKKYIEKENLIKFLDNKLKNISVNPDDINTYLLSINESTISNKTKIINLIKRSNVNINDISKYNNSLNTIINTINSNEIIEECEIRIKYEGYIEREKQIAEKTQRLDNLKIPKNINYNELLSISTEARQKLSKILPETIGQASRISGVSPSDINILLIKFGR